MGMSTVMGYGARRRMTGWHKIVGTAVFLLVVLVALPCLIAASGRSDLYYTLTSVALAYVLYRADQHRPGCIRPDGRLCLRHTGCRLRRLVLAHATGCWSFLRRCQRPHRPADPAPAWRLFRDGHLGPHRSDAASGPGCADYQWREGHRQYSSAGPSDHLRVSDHSRCWPSTCFQCR